MTELARRDLLVRAGGRTLLRHGVPAISSGGVGRTDEAQEVFSRADPATVATHLARDGLAYLAAANRPRLDWPPGLVDAAGRPLAGLLLESSRAQRVENSNHEVDVIGSRGNIASTARDTARALAGAASCKVTTTNAQFSGVYFNKRDNTRFAATVARLHAFSVWVYADAGSIGKTFRPRIEWYDAASGGTQVGLLLGASVPLAAGWNRHALAGLAPTGTVAAIPAFYTDAVLGVFDFWVDLPQFEEAAYPSSAIATGVAGATRATDALDVPLAGLSLDEDWTVYVWALFAHSGLASWADADSAELDPFIFGLYPTAAGTDNALSLRLHRQNSAATYEWEWGSNTPTASRSFTPGAAPQKLVCRHYGATHVLDLSIDGSAFVAAAAPSPAAFAPLRLLRLGNNPSFTARSGFMALFDFAIARGIRSAGEMEEALP